jgi:hypothetical protein
MICVLEYTVVLKGFILSNCLDVTSPCLPEREDKTLSPTSGTIFPPTGSNASDEYTGTRNLSSFSTRNFWMRENLSCGFTRDVPASLGNLITMIIGNVAQLYL